MMVWGDPAHLDGAIALPERLPPGLQPKHYALNTSSLSVMLVKGGTPKKGGLKKKKAADDETGSVSNPLFESMEGMLKQLSQQGATGAGKSTGPNVRVSRLLRVRALSRERAGGSQLI